MSKMSTNIDDLPGPSSYSDSPGQERERDIQTIQVDRLNEIANFNHDGHGQGNLKHPGMLDGTYLNTNNISHKIKKKEIPIESEFNITDEFNITNILLLGIIYVSTLPISDEYTRKLLKLLPFDLVYSNSVTINIIKCILLLILFIIIQKFI